MRTRWTSVLARERAIDWLVAAGDPLSKIVRLLRMSEKSVRRVRDRLHGEVHRDRIRWLDGVVRWASNNGLDIRTCDDFSRLHSDLTHHCLTHLDASPGCVDPALGCKLCRKRALRPPPLPTNFPYRIEVEWSASEGAFVARALLFPELRVVADTIYRAKRELREIGTRLIQDRIRSKQPVPESDIRKYTRRGMVIAIRKLDEAREQPKPKRVYKKKKKAKKIEKDDPAYGVMPGERVIEAGCDDGEDE